MRHIHTATIPVRMWPQNAKFVKNKGIVPLNTYCTHLYICLFQHNSSNSYSELFKYGRTLYNKSNNMFQALVPISSQQLNN